MDILDENVMAWIEHQERIDDWKYNKLKRSTETKEDTFRLFKFLMSTGRYNTHTAATKLGLTPQRLYMMEKEIEKDKKKLETIKETK